MMTKEARNALFQKYSNQFRRTGWTPRRNGVVNQHTHWMCEEAQSFDDGEKAQRWLGFIQGVLWTRGICTIDELRDDVRGVIGPDADEPLLAAVTSAHVE